MHREKILFGGFLNSIPTFRSTQSVFCLHDVLPEEEWRSSVRQELRFHHRRRADLRQQTRRGKNCNGWGLTESRKMGVQVWQRHFQSVRARKSDRRDERGGAGRRTNVAGRDRISERRFSPYG